MTFDGSLGQRAGGIDDLGLNQFSRRYIFHLLARVTAHVEKGSEDLISSISMLIAPDANPYDIEHIWADDFSRYQGSFADATEFANLA